MGELEWRDRLERLDAKTRAYIEDRIEYDTNGGCWLWSDTVYVKSDGFPIRSVQFRGVTEPMHRASAGVYKGQLPADAYVCHTCDNPWCVNPSHLYFGTAKTNTADMVSRGRAVWQREPEKHRLSGMVAACKLTWEQVDKIREDRRSSRAVARDYGVNESAIRGIRKGRTYRPEDRVAFEATRAAMEDKRGRA